MIRLQCACGKAYQLKDEMAGKKVKCPACQGIMTVPLAAVLVEAPTPVPATPATSAVLAPFDGLSPLSGGDPFAGLPPARTLGPALGMANPGFAPPNPLAGPANYPMAAGSKPTSPLVWIIGGISVAVVLGAVIMGVAVVAILTGPNDRPRGYVPPESLSRTVPTGSAPVAGAPGAPGGGMSLPAASIQDQVKAPTITTDWRGRAVVGSQVGQWQMFTSEEGGYQINLPGKPEIVPQSLSTPNGTIRGSVAVVGSDASGLTVVITHMDVPFDASIVPIDKMTEMQIATQGGKIVRTRDVQIGGKPGKEFAAEIVQGPFVGKGVFRSLGSGGRVFTLAFITHGGKFDEAEVARCLDSFTLTKEPPPPKTGGDQPFNGGIPIVRDVQWTKLESAQFHFRVELPAPGKRMETDAAEQQRKETWACEVVGQGAYVFNATKHPIPLPDAALAGSVPLVREALVGQLGHPVTESTSRQGAAQVCDFVFNHPVGMRTLVRAYLTSDVAYQLTWSGMPERASSEEVNRFFNSFAITAGQPGALRPAANSATSADGGWVSHEFKKHGAKAEFPAQPAPMVLPGGGSSAASDGWQATVQGKGAFGILAQFPPAPLPDSVVEPTLQIVKRGVAEKKSRVVSESIRQEEGFYVLDMVVEEKSGARGRIRVYYAKDRNFMLSWTGPANEENSVEVERFFKSFSVLPRPATTEF